MNESGLYVAQMDPAKRAELEAKISRMVAKNSDDPVTTLKIMLLREKDPLGKVLIYQAMVNFAPNDEDVRERLASAIADAKKAAQSNKKTSPPSSPLSASPDGKSSESSPNSSSGSFAVSPMLPPRLSPAEKQKREFIQEAKQQVPQAVASMRANLQAEVQSLAREMQELPLRKKQAEDTIQSINSALKAAKIPEALELDTLALKPYKLKDSKTIKYLKGKKTLKELLTSREEARRIVAECEPLLRVEQDGASSNIESKYRGVTYFIGLLDRLVLTAEDLNEFYGYAKSSGKADDQAEVPEFLEWVIQEKLEEISQAYMAECAERIAALEKEKTAFIKNVVDELLPKAKAQVLDNLDQRRQELREKINRLEGEVADSEEQIRIKEGHLRKAGIPVPNKNESDGVNAGRFGLHKSAGANQQSSPFVTSQPASQQYSSQQMRK